MKFLYSDKKTGKTASVELSVDQVTYLLNRKLGSEIDGTALGFSGYKFKITGGSDSSGFGMDRSISEQLKIRVMRKQKRKGQKRVLRRITVRGNTISTETNQVSASIIEYGSKPLEEMFPKKEKKVEEEKK